MSEGTRGKGFFDPREYADPIGDKRRECDLVVAHAEDFVGAEVDRVDVASGRRCALMSLSPEGARVGWVDEDGGSHDVGEYDARAVCRWVQWGDASRRPYGWREQAEVRESNNAVHWVVRHNLAPKAKAVAGFVAGPVLPYGGTIIPRGGGKPVYPHEVGIVAPPAWVAKFRAFAAAGRLRLIQGDQ